MQARLSLMFTTGAMAALCAAAILLPSGCQSSNRQVAQTTETPNGPTQVCPVCGRETRRQPLTGLKYTTCVCPTCRQVSTIDPETLQKLEDVYGYLPEFMTTVCEGCGTVVNECATCRQARG